ncbi:MAG: metal ABC transporter permease [Alphaproteobacteria bacterium]
MTSLIAGIGIALCASVLGCFMLWQRMSYFGDSLSHSILLGIIIGISFNISPIVAGLIFAILIAFILNLLDSKHTNDSLLGILAQSCLAISIIVNSYSNKLKIDLNYYLFGDILAVAELEIFEIYIILVLIYIWLKLRWASIITIIISKELAYADKLPVKRIKLELIFLIAITITISIKIVGILLITSMLIIPAATSKIISSSPKQMIICASIISVIASIIGVFLSQEINAPTGPLIVVTNLIIFIILHLKNSIYKYKIK